MFSKFAVQNENSRRVSNGIKVNATLIQAKNVVECDIGG